MPERDNWRRVTMNDAAQFLNGYPFKPTDWSEQGTPIVRIAQMTGTLDGCDRYRNLVPEQVSALETGTCSSPGALH